MKKALILLCGFLFWAQTALGAEPAIEFVKSLTDNIITNVLESKDSREEKMALFKKEFQNALDLKAIGQFVSGVYWKRATTAEREAFITAFMDFTTKTWADRFDMYEGQKIVFTGVRSAGRGQLYVDSQIQNNPPVEVIWRLREKGNDYKIIDIIVEGVSMAMSYRNEYTAFLQKNGGKLSVLTKELEDKSAHFQWTQSAK